MKTIGIKLADGTFYPIMEEGSAEKKELSLTTVKDNQTTVQVDLYRSATGSMEDAEYIDSLEIKNLVKHPNGEADISLDISLDENNELKAELHDPETGGDSTTTVTLVSRTLEQLNSPSDVTFAEADDFDLDESLSSSVPQETFDGDDDLTFDPNSLNVDSIVEDTPAEEPVVEDAVVEEPAVEEPAIEDDFDIDAVSDDELSESEESSDNSFGETAAVAAGAGLLGAAAAAAMMNGDDKTETEEPVFTDEDFNVPDDFEITDTTSTEFSMDDLDIPDDFATEEESVDETVVSDSTVSISDELVTEESSVEASDDDFSLDDFTMPEMSDDITEESSSFSEESGFTSDSDTTAPAEDDMFENSGNAGLDFSDILDEETKEGHAGTSDTEVTRKKTKVPVTICIICAIICIIAVILILFVIPSNVNILKKTAASKPAVEQPVTETPVTKEPDYSAKEDEIVVAPAEVVVPEVPKQTAPESKNITYKIKWGDTLWDIAQSYYNNPWKYHKIAKYNGIKNPDHIISGTTITIPAE